MNATIRHGFGTAAFRFGHTLVRNQFEKLNCNYVSVSEGPLYVRASFFNNLPKVENGIEPIMYGLFGDNGDAEDFDNTFLASVGQEVFILPGDGGFRNLAALKIQKGRDHGLESYQELRTLCGIFLAKHVGSNPFTVFRSTISNPKILDDLKNIYGTPESHIDLFAAGTSESNDGKKLRGRTFGCILSKTFQALRDGDRQQKQIKKMNMARVMCLTLRDAEKMQKNLFDVFEPGRD